MSAWRDAAAAGHVGDEATARGALDSPDPVVRELALGALDRLGALDDATLLTAFDDADAQVRRRAVTIAARRPGVPLLAMLDDPMPAVVETAAWACGERAATAPAVLDRLIALAGSADDALVREAAVAALGAIGDERALPAILSACTDKPAVRRRAVLALAPFDGPQVEAALQAALDDRDWQVRQAAEDLTR
ncbi:MAG: HEAT repeat domain-containing protein [Ilumatobacteraceae bacterium]